MKPDPDLIDKALAKLEADRGADPPKIFNSEGKIPNKYKGYISSFGGSIVQMGVMPACMAFIANSEKEKLLAMLFDIYYEDKFGIAENITLKEYLKDWATWNHSDKKQFRNRMAAVAVSFKLALRTFEIDEEDN
ncbi:MAG: hypothetical protein ACRESZ_20165 [Methylococcales bacterium]